MTRWLLRAVFGAVLAGGCGLSIALAAQPGDLTIRDNLKLFSEAGIKAAQQDIAMIRATPTVHLTVETFDKLPEDVKRKVFAAKGDKNELSKIYSQWSLERAKANPVGAYVMIVFDKAAEARAIRARTSDKMTQKIGQTADDQIAKIFSDAMKKAQEQSPSEAVKTLDAALLDTVKLLKDKMHEAEVIRTQAATSPASAKNNTSNTIAGWLCIGLMVLMGLWLIVGLIRAFTGGGGAGGAGGGGILGGLLAGMFGAMAGMWIYNSFFGDSTPSAMGGDSFGPGGTTSGTDGYSGDGAGGDWGTSGGDAAGGDWGD